jgi:hypothetical protein
MVCTVAFTPKYIGRLQSGAVYTEKVTSGSIPRLEIGLLGRVVTFQPVSLSGKAFVL